MRKNVLFEKENRETLILQPTASELCGNIAVPCGGKVAHETFPPAGAVHR
jgi:hypothetical protein